MSKSDKMQIAVICESTEEFMETVRFLANGSYQDVSPAWRVNFTEAETETCYFYGLFTTNPEDTDCIRGIRLDEIVVSGHNGNVLNKQGVMLLQQALPHLPLPNGDPNRIRDRLLNIIRAY